MLEFARRSTCWLILLILREPAAVRVVRCWVEHLLKRCMVALDRMSGSAIMTNPQNDKPAKGPGCYKAAPSLMTGTTPLFCNQTRLANEIWI